MNGPSRADFLVSVSQYAAHGRDDFTRRVCQELLRADAVAETARKFITRSATEQDLYAAVFAWWTTRHGAATDEDES